MLVDVVINVFFGFARFILSYLPAFRSIPDWFNSFCVLLRYALFFFPYDVWIILISDIFFCNAALIVWSIIEWAYKKAPGVD